MKRILLFFISMFLMSFSLMAQEINEVEQDTTAKKTFKYGIRVGGDLSKLARTAFEDGYTGFELNGDIRVYKRFFAAVEIGNETREFDESNLTANFKGSYLKIGGDYNAYNNWLGMENAIFAGLRYGIASYTSELTSYGIFTTDTTFPTEIVTEPREFKGLTASWTELIFGVKTELINNLYLSINLQLKYLISKPELDNFDSLIIPGYNKTNDFSKFGVGYGYTLSYLIPIFKK